ncbi:MAG: GGDEF domain-containing protein [Pirellulales bacterium]
MVEILCIAAELTAGLLVASILWDRAARSASTSQHAHTPTKVQAIRELFLLQEQCLHLRNRLDQDESDDAWLQSHRQTMHLIQDELRECLPQGYSDRLTHLRNQAYFEHLIEQPSTQGSLAMFDIDGFKAINDEHGMDVGDLLLRQLAEKLQHELVTTAWLIRYEGGKLIAYFPSLQIERAIPIVEDVRVQMTRTPFEVKGKSLQVGISASLIAVATEEQRGTATERLLEGMAFAKSEGRNRGYYRASDTWNLMKLLETELMIGKVQEEQGTITAKSAKPSVPLDEIGMLVQNLDQPKEASPPAEAPAAMSTGDIEALLANASTAKAASKEPAKKPEEQTERASTDDIAALFASNRPPVKAAKAPEPTASTEPKETTAESKPADKKETPEASGDQASADDIAALFASNRPAKAPAKAPKAEEAAKPATPPAAESGDSASADDIAALFAAAKPAPAKPKVDPQPAEEQPEAMPTVAKVAEPTVAAPVANSAVSEKADGDSISTDDIAALFAATKPKAAPAPATKAEEKEILEASQALAEDAKKATQKEEAKAKVESKADADSISTDDIAALFASMKQP